MPIIDKQELQKMTAGDMDLASDLAIMFVQQLPEIQARIRNGLEFKDYNAVALCAHQLKSRVGYFGANELREKIDVFEALATLQHADKLSKLHADLSSDLFELVGELRELTNLELRIEEEELAFGELQ